ncbi:hypothetical protein [Streptomyces alkaliphilus]|uniref:hypothetical protein n=1 Tax=Streptomyces alkaliphilus TaxID=1472722 RepID=UPI00117E28F1|nr:hypothetical protein [Streptomyces alkaliphilus]MQS06443.1 hypothetical protein [Streptomyces alkaliphilus]
MTDMVERYGRRAIALFIGYVLSAVALALAVVEARTVVFFTAFLINYATDWGIRLSSSPVNSVMRRFGFGERIREFNRLLLLVMIAIVTTTPVVTPLAFTVGALFILNSSHAPLVGYRQRRRNVPVAVLNLDMSALRVPDAPRATQWHERGLIRIPGPELIIAAVLAGVLLGAAPEMIWLAVLAPLVSLVAAAQLARHAMRNRDLPEPEEMIGIINRQLEEYRPRVALYFTFAAGGQDFMYQVNMWIDTLERLDHKAVIILRETAAMAQLEQTRLPVICVRKADHLALLDLPEVRVVLYPGNAGKNVHMLQRAEAQHVFIGHGDSDKLASSNRVSRVFDEIWVAGRAGRDRYRRVAHAIDDAAIVEVGRPQLGAVRPAAKQSPAAPVTVLYGPTWEGWTDDACHTSLIPMGERLIRDLLSREGVRVVYKPHPLTGKRSPEAERADAKVRDLIRKANERLRENRDPALVADTERRLAAIERRVLELTEGAEGGDRLQHTRDARPAEGDVRAEVRLLQDEWSELFWSDAYQGGRHLIVTERQPSLYDCFNRSDVLISDMSSVISDFVASRKPYVVTNILDMDPEEYRLQNPTAGGAYLLGADCAGLDEILEAVRTEEADTMASRRMVLKEYLLGPDHPDSMVRFNEAVNTLYAKGVRHFPPGTLAEPVPAGPDYPVLPRPRTSSEVTTPEPA